MKKVIILFTLLVTMVAHAQTSDEAKLISSIQERGGTRSILFERTQDSLIFSIEEEGFKTHLRTLRASYNRSSVKAKNSFKLISSKPFFGATEDMFECLSNTAWESGCSSEVMGPLVILPVLIAPVPLLIGVALLPVDAAINLIDSVFSKRSRAARKLKKLLVGKNKRVGTPVFNEMTRMIQRL